MDKKESIFLKLLPLTGIASIIIIIGLIKVTIEYFMTGIFYYATRDGIGLLIIFAMIIYSAVLGYVEMKRGNKSGKQ